jgi:hypothetical protein
MCLPFIIDVENVREAGRLKDPRFLSLFNDMSAGLSDPQHAFEVCVHEVAQFTYLDRAGLAGLRFGGPQIIYKAEIDKFAGRGARVITTDCIPNAAHLSKISNGAWVKELVLGFAAGGVAAEVLANASNNGDEEDRELFDKFCESGLPNGLKVLNGAELWDRARDILTDELQIPRIKEPILTTAKALRFNLFGIS